MTRNKKIIIIIGAIAIVLAIGEIISRYSPFKSGRVEIIAVIPEESQEKSIKEITPEQVLAEYNQTRTSEQRETVTERIKSIFGEDLQITFKEAKTRYYSYGIPDPATITDFCQLKVIETYEDNKGFNTEVDAATSEILKREKSCTQETQWITLDQAKESAKNLLIKLVSDLENYELMNESTGRVTYYSFWRKRHEGDFYNEVPGGKEKSLAKMEDRTIAICTLNGELMSYEYKPVLTEEEVTEMVNRWDKTQKQDIEVIRKFLNSPDKQFIFVNYMGCSECGEGGTSNSFRVYRDENGYCYDVDPNGNITPDTEILKDCKTPQL